MPSSSHGKTAFSTLIVSSSSCVASIVGVNVKTKENTMAHARTFLLICDLAIRITKPVSSKAVRDYLKCCLFD